MFLIIRQGQDKIIQLGQMNTKNTCFNRTSLQQFLISNLKSIALIQTTNQVNEVCSKLALLIIKSVNEQTLLYSAIHPCKLAKLLVP